MLSKTEIQFVRSLQHKESRIESGMFTAEGHKVVTEMLASGFSPEMLIATEEWAASNTLFAKKAGDKFRQASRAEIERCSSFKSPQEVIAVCKMPEAKNINDVEGSLVLALDDVQDPGNTGTILRIAAWFGIKYVLCSEACADLYNPKVIQASMGAFYRVNAVYGDLTGMLGLLKKKGYTIGATFIEGSSVAELQPQSPFVIVMGNESRGVSESVKDITDISISIPSFSPSGSGIESLNVSTAASIVCYELIKKNYDANRK